jgi:hypothetical protein
MKIVASKENDVNAHTQSSEGQGRKRGRNERMMKTAGEVRD